MARRNSFRLENGAKTGGKRQNWPGDFLKSTGNPHITFHGKHAVNLIVIPGVCIGVDKNHHMKHAEHRSAKHSRWQAEESIVHVHRNFYNSASIHAATLVLTSQRPIINNRVRIGITGFGNGRLPGLYVVFISQNKIKHRY